MSAELSHTATPEAEADKDASGIDSDIVELLAGLQEEGQKQALGVQ